MTSGGQPTTVALKLPAIAHMQYVSEPSLKPKLSAHCLVWSYVATSAQFTSPLRMTLGVQPSHRPLIPSLAIVFLYKSRVPLYSLSDSGRAPCVYKRTFATSVGLATVIARQPDKKLARSFWPPEAYSPGSKGPVIAFLMGGYIPLPRP